MENYFTNVSFVKRHQLRVKVQVSFLELDKNLYINLHYEKLQLKVFSKCSMQPLGGYDR